MVNTLSSKNYLKVKMFVYKGILTKSKGGALKFIKIAIWKNK